MKHNGTIFINVLITFPQEKTMDNWLKFKGKIAKTDYPYKIVFSTSDKEESYYKVYSTSKNTELENTIINEIRELFVKTFPYIKPF